MPHIHYTHILLMSFLCFVLSHNHLSPCRSGTPVSRPSINKHLASNCVVGAFCLSLFPPLLVGHNLSESAHQSCQPSRTKVYSVSFTHRRLVDVVLQCWIKLATHQYIPTTPHPIVQQSNDITEERKKFKHETRQQHTECSCERVIDTIC